MSETEGLSQVFCKNLQAISKSIVISYQSHQIDTRFPTKNEGKLPTGKIVIWQIEVLNLRKLFLASELGNSLKIIGS